MATIRVTSLSDIAADDGVTTLREAVAQANASAGIDTIVFDALLSGGVLRLSQGEIDINDAVTIDAAGLEITISGDANNDDVNVTGTTLTDIDASSANLADNTRIFDITGSSSETTIVGLTLTGGRATGFFDGGGAISSDADLTLQSVTISGNVSQGTFGSGGGVAARGDVTLVDSTITGNRTTSNSSEGGGVFSARGIYAIGTTIEGNLTSGNGADGGGLSANSLVLLNSTVSNNATIGLNSDGGGLAVESNATLINTSVSGNLTAGSFSDGGGIYSQHRLSLIHSTVSGNSTAGDSATGGGVSVAGRPNNGVGGIELVNSIVLGNVSTADSTTNELFLGGTYGATITSTGNNIIGNNLYTGSVVASTTSANDVFSDTYELLIDTNADGIGDTATGVLAGSLSNNGGNIETIAIRSGGAAQNAADSGATTDQFDIDSDSVTAEALPEDAIGNDRGLDTGADIGAFEITVPQVTVTTVILSNGSISKTTFVDGKRTQLEITETDGDVATTTFDPAGQRETFTFEDVSDTRNWTSYSDVYDATGALTSRTLLLDNGSASKTTFVDGKRTQLEVTETDGDVATSTFDPSNRLDTFTFEDVSDTRNWNSYTTEYDPAGAITSRTLRLDDGSTSQTTFVDGKRTQLEVTEADGDVATSTFDLNNRLDTFTFEDVSDTRNWNSYTTEYDPAGVLTSRTLRLDDGSAAQTTFVDGKRTQLEVTETDGDVATSTFDLNNRLDTFTFEDVSGTRNWSSYTNEYDPAGAVTASTFLFDDGSASQTTFVDGKRTQLEVTETDGDVATTTFGPGGQRETFMFEDLSDTRNWTSYINEYDAAGALTSSTFLFDDGSTSTNNFLDG